MDSASASDHLIQELRQLVLAAFDKARNSGKPNWRHMTLAVLKNRLLQITDHEFSLRRYDVSTMPQLVGLIPDLVLLEQGPPAAVHLRDDAESEAGDKRTGWGGKSGNSDVDIPWRHLRIRDDLWQATLDYAGNAIYVLDPETGLARPKILTDGDLPQLPTIDVQTIRSWRQSFIDQVAVGENQTTRNELAAWVEGSGATHELPRPLRGKWSETVKKRVSGLLNQWFLEHRLEIPADMHVEAASRGTTESDTIDDVVATRRLRSTLVRALSLMTYEEMGALSIPASVVVRLTDHA